MGMLMKCMRHEMKWLVTHGNIKRNKARRHYNIRHRKTTQNKGQMSAKYD
jgi:hypothetical protein